MLKKTILIVGLLITCFTQLPGKYLYFYQEKAMPCLDSIGHAYVFDAENRYTFPTNIIPLTRCHLQNGPTEEYKKLLEIGEQRFLQEKLADAGVCVAFFPTTLYELLFLLFSLQDVVSSYEKDSEKNIFRVRTIARKYQEIETLKTKDFLSLSVDEWREAQEFVNKEYNFSLSLEFIAWLHQKTDPIAYNRSWVDNFISCSKRDVHSFKRIVDVKYNKEFVLSYINAIEKINTDPYAQRLHWIVNNRIIEFLQNNGFDLLSNNFQEIGCLVVDLIIKTGKQAQGLIDKLLPKPWIFSHKNLSFVDFVRIFTGDQYLQQFRSVVLSCIDQEVAAQQQEAFLLYRGTCPMNGKIDSTVHYGSCNPVRPHEVCYGQSPLGSIFFDSRQNGAAAICFMIKQPLAYVVQINKRDYLVQGQSSDFFFIPPLSTLVNLAGYGRSFHPRAKIYVEDGQVECTELVEELSFLIQANTPTSVGIEKKYKSIYEYDDGFYDYVQKNYVIIMGAQRKETVSTFS